MLDYVNGGEVFKNKIFDILYTLDGVAKTKEFSFFGENAVLVNHYGKSDCCLFYILLLPALLSFAKRAVFSRSKVILNRNDRTVFK